MARRWKCEECGFAGTHDLKKGRRPVCHVCRYRAGLERAVEAYRRAIGAAVSNYATALRLGLHKRPARARPLPTWACEVNR